MASSRISAGALDRELTIQTAPEVQSDSGELSFDWDNAVEQTVWAQWLPAGTREAWQSQQRLGAYIDGVFRMYYIDPPPTPDDTRILFEGKEYDIKPCIEIGRREGLDIPATARGV